ncbi:MAG: sulfatase-like hydrolase/transferase [Lachnospiraceae bacterium]|nr:sulfatase-like hydrolase/transferase [Lachnospiraceae bacterium]
MKFLLKTNKLWWISGGVLSALLITLLFWFNGHNIKHTVLGLGLALGTGALIACKKISFKFSVPVLLLYLLYVPGKLFDRMELPIHDFTHIMSLAKFVTALLFIVLYLIIYIFCRNFGMAMGIGNILIFIVSVIEFYVNKFRGSVIGVNDLLVVKTAISVMGGYDYTPSHELIYSLLWFAFFTVLAFSLSMSAKDIKTAFPKYPSLYVYIGMSVLAVALAITSWAVLFKSDFVTKSGLLGDDWREVKANEKVGSLLYPVTEYHRNHMRKPEGYSADTLKSLCDEASRNFKPIHETEDTLKPDVFLIMNESLANLGVLGDIKTDIPVLPFIESLSYDKNAVVGNLHMSVLGGLTVNSEFEALTGNSMHFFASSSIPYSNMIKEGIPSLASEFEALGYCSLAIHPNYKKAYDREDVYGKMGFDKFSSIYDFIETPDYVRDYVSDESNYKEIIAEYESRDTDKPFFCFNVTIQNHGGYFDTLHDVSVTSINGIDYTDKVKPEGLEEYLSLARKSDDAFKELIEYFKTVERPVVVCMFGDHQPLLGDDFYRTIYEGRDLTDTEKNDLKYITPYVLWSNYNLEFTDLKDFSANYLGAVLLDEIGLPMSGFRKFQRNLMEEIPVLSSYKTANVLGRNLTTEELKDSKGIAEYKMFQYSMLFDYSEETSFISKPEEYNLAGYSAKEIPWNERKVITHALGITSDNVESTNSLDAFLNTYKKGQRVFEADVAIASDGVPVLRHDWELDLGQADIFGRTEGKINVPTAEKYVNTPILGKYKALTLLDWFKIMDEYPDVWFVSDTKFTTEVKEQFEIIVKTAIDNGYESVLDRMIVQVYYPEMVEKVDAVYRFKNYILTVYYLGEVPDKEILSNLFKNDRVKALTMPLDRWESCREELMGSDFAIYVHTVDDFNEAAHYLKDGIGIYSDNITDREAACIIEENK